MASGSTKRAWKLQEFVAHGANVNCVALGHKSGRFMVTGGDDKKVNMWAVGKPNCMLSLSGHTSAVEAVRFGNAEDMVVAGSLSGALKIWNIESAKIMRTLTGHKSSIRSLDFHPYGGYVASGSKDTNIKLWDIRRKGCIFTYKGHSEGVTSLRFSPDGRWIASAGEDGLLKLWDLVAGKLLHDFRQHTAAINAIEFHPNEFLIVSAGADRTVNYWDLETFQLVSSTDGDSTPIRCVFFHPEGRCLYSGAADMLKVYGWEPASCYDSLAMGWGKVADIVVAQNQLIGATCNETNVSIHVVDVNRVQPLGGPPHSSPPVKSSGSSSKGGQRRSFCSERPPTMSTRQAPPRESPEEEEEATTPGDEREEDDNPNPQDYSEVFQTRHRIDRSPSRLFQPFPAPPDEDMPSPMVPKQSPAPARTQRVTSPPRQLPDINSATRNVANPASPVAPRPHTSSSRPASNGKTSARPVKEPSTPTKETSKPPAAKEPTRVNSASKEPTRVNSASKEPTRVNNASKEPTRVNSGGKARPTQPPTRDNAPPNKRTESKPEEKQSSGLNPEDFLPKQSVPSLAGGDIQASMSDAEAIMSIAKGHDSMTAVLNSRSKNLQIVRALWTAGNTKTAIDSAVGMNDNAIIVDLLNILIMKPALWNLDLCATMLPQMSGLVSSKYESYVTASLTALRLVLKNFATVIKSNMVAPPSLGVDITREERYHKCKACYKHLLDIRSELGSKRHVSASPLHRELNLLMDQLD